MYENQHCSIRNSPHFIFACGVCCYIDVSFRLFYDINKITLIAIQTVNELHVCIDQQLVLTFLRLNSN